MKILLNSFSNRDVIYEVDKSNGRCSCPAYAADKWCKHLEAVGSYKPRNVTLSLRPSFSQALSGLVKSIRVRNVTEGAYWLKYCWGFREKLAGSQYRTVRRLLIGAAEDGHSIAVMEKLADNFGSLLSPNVDFSIVLAELLLICKIPNWWHPSTGGHDYIYAGMLALRKMLYDGQTYGIEQCLLGVTNAIDEQDKVAGLCWVLRADESGKGANLALAIRVHEIAIARKNVSATRLMNNIHLRHAKALSNDNNFIGQAVWLLSGGCSPITDAIEPITTGEVSEVLDKVNATAPYVIPGWCCDGIHCAGNDIRYMGSWDRMVAVCQQFNHYQRVSPDDEWLEDDFYSLDGLKAKKRNIANERIDDDQQ